MADMNSTEREMELLNESELENYVPVDGEVSESYTDECKFSIGDTLKVVGGGAALAAGAYYIGKKVVNWAKSKIQQTESYGKYLDKKAEKQRARLDKIELERANRKVVQETKVEKPEETK